MNIPDLDIIRLQYEILNVSEESICERNGLNPQMLQDVIEKYNWKRWWSDPKEPEIDFIDGEDEFGEDALSIQSEAYIDRTRKRLSAYALAKQVLLAQKYLELEAGLVQKAIDAIGDLDTTNATGIKALSALYKDLAKGSSLDGALSIGLGQDNDGLPQLIVRDLAGGNNG